MSTSEKYSDTLIKCAQIKSTANGDLKLFYYSLFDLMFGNGLLNEIKNVGDKKNINDADSFNRCIFLKIIPEFNNLEKKFKLTPSHEDGIKILDTLSSHVQEYIIKKCNIVLTKKCIVDKEENSHIISQYGLFNCTKIYINAVLNNNFNVLDCINKVTTSGKLNSYTYTKFEIGSIKYDQWMQIFTGDPKGNIEIIKDLIKDLKKQKRPKKKQKN